MIHTTLESRANRNGDRIRSRLISRAWQVCKNMGGALKHSALVHKAWCVCKEAPKTRGTRKRTWRLRIAGRNMSSWSSSFEEEEIDVRQISTTF